MYNQEDRRIRKTKKALRNELIELLNEKNIQNITVKELTDKADIHRSTFYANFKDVYDLYSHMEDTVIQEIKDLVSIDYTFKPTAFFHSLLSYVNENRQISRLFLSGNIGTAFFEQLTEMFKDACIECWCKEHNVTNISDEMSHYVQFCFSGGLGVIGMWVAEGFQYPIEALAKILSDIDSNVGKIIGEKLK